MKEGWEYKKLGDIGTFIRGGNFSKRDFVEDGFPCIHYGQIHMKFGVETLRNISSVPAEMVKYDRCAKKGDLVIAITSEDDAGSCKCTAWMGDYDVYVGGHTAIYRHTMQPKYVSYYFMSPYFQKDKLEYTHGFKVVEISPKDIAKISIPVPPLSEQQSIVDYLDSAFAKIDAMKANAEKALGEAKALFQASLKEMLEPKDGWEEKTLGDVCVKSKNIRWEEYQDGKLFTYIDLTSVDRETLTIVEPQIIDKNNAPSRAKQIVKSGDIIFATTRPTLRRVCLISEDFDNQICSTGFCVLRPKEDVISKWIFFSLLNEDFYKYIEPLQTGASYPAVTDGIVKNYLIYFPSLRTDQQQIISQLDFLKSKVDRLQENFDKISQECDALKQAILRQVFE